MGGYFGITFYQFNNTDISIHEMLEKVKINSYWWLKAANAVYVLGVHN